MNCQGLSAEGIGLLSIGTGNLGVPACFGIFKHLTGEVLLRTWVTDQYIHGIFPTKNAKPFPNSCGPWKSITLAEIAKN